MAYDTNLGYIARTEEPCRVLIIVDAISRKYFTGETSWLWDIDFDRLNCEHVQKVMLYGKYCNDLAVRFKYTHVPADKVEVGERVATAAEYLRENGDEDVYVITCFSDRDKLLSLAEKD